MVGDTHGNGRWVKHHVFPYAERGDVDAIVQVGDFGLWPGEAGREFLDIVESEANRIEKPWFWLDGNHEDFSELEERGCFKSSTPCHIKDHIIYLPRGCVWEWGSKTFMAMGGAFSIDKRYHVPYQSWWPQEEITGGDLIRAERNMVLQGKVTIDVLLSHDCPSGTQIPGVHADGKEAFPEAGRNRRMLKWIVDVYEPRLVVHGHYHHRYSKEAGPASRPRRIEGLACDGFRNAMAILDTEGDLKLEDI